MPANVQIGIPVARDAGEENHPSRDGAELSAPGEKRAAAPRRDDGLKPAPPKAPEPQEKRHAHHPLPSGQWARADQGEALASLDRMHQRLISRHGEGSAEAERAWEARARCEEHLMDRWRPGTGYVRLVNPRAGRQVETPIEDLRRYLNALFRNKLREVWKRERRWVLGLDGGELVAERERRPETWIELAEVGEVVEEKLMGMKISDELRAAIRRVLGGEVTVVRAATLCGTTRDVLQRRVGEVRRQLRERHGFGARTRKRKR